MVFPLRSFVLFLTIILVLSGCTISIYADTEIPQPIQLHPPTQTLDLSVTTKTTTSTTTQTTIAPIQTKAPEVKPPVEQPSLSPVTSIPTPVSTKTKITTPLSTTQTTPKPSEPADESVSPDVNYQWGFAYENIGQYTDAISEYNKAIAKDPSYADAWYRKGVTLEKKGQFDAAKEAYVILLAINPSYTSTEESSNLTYLRGNVTGNLTGIDGLMRVSLVDPDIIIGILLLIIIVVGVFFYLNRENTLFQTKKKSPDKSAEKQGFDANGFNHHGNGYDTNSLESLFDAATAHHPGNPLVIRAVLTIACQISVEGREGKPVGTAFIVGDSDEVLQRSRQLILNPVSGHPRDELSIMNPAMTEYFKELAQLDGAFVISDDGVVEAAGRYISIDTGDVLVPKGLGTRHVSVAAITSVTNALGIVVSESGGGIRIYVKGKDIS